MTSIIVTLAILFAIALAITIHAIINAPFDDE